MPHLASIFRKSAFHCHEPTLEVADFVMHAVGRQARRT
jgi:hypothetical protein